MTSWITRLLLCALAGAAQAQDIVVGAVVSRTGVHADLAAGYAKGMQLWESQVNAAGGLLGRRVELRILDDGSDAARAGEAYRRLIAEMGAAVLIGPYGSAATRVAATEAERGRKVMVNGAGPARVVQDAPGRLLFQTSSPYSARGDGLLELAKKAGLTRLYIAARGEFAAVEMAEGTRLAALARGFTVPEVETYSLWTTDFQPVVERAYAAQAQAFLAFGEARDAADLVKTFRRMGYAPQLFFARRAGDPQFVAAVGQDAEFTLAELDYEPRLARPGNAEFVKAYRARFSASPDLAAAEGYSAALVLGEAVRRAGTLDTEKLRGVLAAMEADTPLGRYRAGANGRQLDMAPAIGQVQRGRPEVVWPFGLETGKPLQPYPQWNDRQVIQ